jgi:hypothetical protein
MPVFVDPIFKWPTAIRCFKAGSCHLYADTLDELHAMAVMIGMRREWFQDKPGFPHYDLTPAKRERAVRMGAIEHDMRSAVEWKRRGKCQFN